jgi:hypothetical protein
VETRDDPQQFVIGWKLTSAGKIPCVRDVLLREDVFGMIRVRLGIGRMEYRVAPGLYALGDPDESSEVLATANYKLTFDILRSHLRKKNVWILVLDTDGINVWCAAGKGTFSTTELAYRIKFCNLETLVSHRRIIIPQLAASGVCAREIRSLTGFRAIFGPIDSADIPRFFELGLKATPDMRRKTFGITERMVLIPIELVESSKRGVFIVPAFLLFACLAGQDGCLSNILNRGLFAVLALFIGIASGGAVTPLLLPWIPGRSFTTKGLVAGAVTGAAFLLSLALLGIPLRGIMASVGLFFMILGVSSFLAMNFTGASTFTSLSGVIKEMRWGVPLEIVLASLGVGFWMWSVWFS